MNYPRTLPAVLLCAFAIALLQGAVAGTACPFCAAPLGDPPSFCASCGRVVLDPADMARRSWLDAVFLVDYPPVAELPEVRLEQSEKGTVARAVFLTGDRYEFGESKGRLRFEGKVAGQTAKSAVAYSGTIEDLRDDAGRIRGRRVQGVLEVKPPRHLVRTVDYRYDADGRLAKIEIVTWHYRRAADAEKAPSTWLEHERAEIVVRHEAGRVSGVEGTIQRANRDLRGETYFEEPSKFERGLDVRSTP